jgi:hypothetical protein
MQAASEHRSHLPLDRVVLHCDLLLLVVLGLRKDCLDHKVKSCQRVKNIAYVHLLLWRHRRCLNLSFL